MVIEMGDKTDNGLFVVFAISGTAAMIFFGLITAMIAKIAGYDLVTGFFLGIFTVISIGVCIASAATHAATKK